MASTQDTEKPAAPRQGGGPSGRRPGFGEERNRESDEFLPLFCSPTDTYGEILARPAYASRPEARQQAGELPLYSQIAFSRAGLQTSTLRSPWNFITPFSRSLDRVRDTVLIVKPR